MLKCFAPLLLVFTLSAQAAVDNDNQSMYYIDASFSGCDAMGICQEMRVESILHSLATMGRTPLQTSSLSGKYMPDFIAKIKERLNEWTIDGVRYPPKHVIVGFVNDVFLQDRTPIIEGAKQISRILQSFDPEIQVWFIEYPPAEGLNATGKRMLPGGYEEFREQYEKTIEQLPNAEMIVGVYDDWSSSNAYHPLLPDGDYHLDQRSATDAALRIYVRVRDTVRPAW